MKIISLTVFTDEDDGVLLFSRFSDIAIDIQPDVKQVSVHSIDVDDEPECEEPDEIEEFFDEGTLQKVYEAIRSVAPTREDVTDIVNALQNAGILFREIKK